MITFLDFGTDDWFSDQFDDLVFGEIDELTRDDDLVNKQGGYANDGLDGLMYHFHIRNKNAYTFWTRFVIM